MRKIHEFWRRRVTAMLDPAGRWVALLPVRLLLAYEYGNAGLKKLNGSNWFGRVQDDFPFPFNVIPVEISWFIATWTEILGAAGLALGLFTRFWAFSLIVLTIVAIAGVHWPDAWPGITQIWKGYSVSPTDYGNFRIPFLFLAMLVPLLLAGAGRLSVDYWLCRRFRGPE